MKRVLLALVVLLLMAGVLAIALERSQATAAAPSAPSTVASQVDRAELHAPGRTPIAPREQDPGRNAPSVQAPSLDAALPVAFVYGTVRGPDGLPVRDAHVRFSSLGTGSAWERPRDLDCDLAGSYSGELPPGPWMASVVLGVSNSAPQRDDAFSARNHPFRFLVQPPPRIDTLAARMSTELSFQFGAGPGAIDGRVVDELARPFAGLEVYLAVKELENATTGERHAMGLSSLVAKGVTDEQGRFGFEGLEPATYTVTVEPEGFNPTAAPGESKVGQRVPLHDVLVADGRASLQVTARRPHPVRIDGRLLPYASGSSLTLILPANDQGRKRDRRTIVPIAKDGAFTLYVEGHELFAILEVLGRETTTVPLAFSPADEAFFITIPLP